MLRPIPVKNLSFTYAETELRAFFFYHKCSILTAVIRSAILDQEVPIEFL